MDGHSVALSQFHRRHGYRFIDARDKHGKKEDGADRWRHVSCNGLDVDEQLSSLRPHYERNPGDADDH